jgi:hypothetical protein
LGTTEVVVVVAAGGDGVVGDAFEVVLVAADVVVVEEG